MIDISLRADYIHNPAINGYYKKPPFDPPERYPELPFVSEIDKENWVYPMVRKLLQRLGLDRENMGTERWSPFRDIIKNTDKVLIKPNLVIHSHFSRKSGILSTIVHGSVLRPIIDYIYMALGDEGIVVIADNPIESADFEEIMEVSGIKVMVDALQKRAYKNLKIIDLRPQITKEGSNGLPVEIKVSGDPLGLVMIDLGKDSCFAELDINPNISYYTLGDKTVDHLDPGFKKKSKTDEFHKPQMHKYVISKTVLDSDVIINVAKLKTHCKAGVTLSLKNLLGIVGGKVCMPHHRPGPPPIGDSFPEYPPYLFTKSRKLYQKLKSVFYLHHIPIIKAIASALHRSKPIEHGNWKGNDTIWRTILDINRIALYADKSGMMCDTPQRKIFCLIDGIIGQEGNAPIGGTPTPCGILIGGFNPVLVDALGVKTMGIDYQMIPTISKAKGLKKWKLIPEDTDLSFGDIETPNFNFEMPKGWR